MTSRTPSRPPFPRGPGTRSGFTLIELLVVIGIILILIGILFPAISGIRREAMVTSTKQEMSRLQSGIGAYYLDYRAYPGPFSENQVYPQVAPVPQSAPLCPDPATSPYALTLATGSAGPAPTFPNGVTSTENLFVGLEGCVAYYPPPGPPTPGFFYTPPSSAPSGPASLNPANPGTHASYMSYTPNETTYDGSADMNAGMASNVSNSGILPITAGVATDSSIPEFVDHFSTPRPILYMRARVGTTGMLYTIAGTSYPASTAATSCQYNEQQLQPYGWVSTLTYNPPSSTTPSNQQMAVNKTYYVPNSTYNLQDEVYFANPGITGVPKGKDGWILISAGPDGVYGDNDDIILSN